MNAIETLASKSFLLWLLEHWCISSGESRGEKYSFAEHQFLLEIAKTKAPYAIIQKSAQCGISELMIAQMFYLQDTKPGNTLYVFPADTQMKDFVAGRVRPAIEQSDYLRNQITADYNLQRIKFSDNFIYFRGSQNTRQLRSIDASRLFLDEVDEMPPETVGALARRLGAIDEPLRFRRDYSTPSLPDVGINALYLESDCREWTLKCEHCGRLQSPNWEENVFNFGSELEPDVDTICKRCKRKLNRLAQGKYIAQKKSDIPGFQISKLFSPKASLNQIWRDIHNPILEQVVWNYDLGLPHKPKGASLTTEILNSCRGSHRLMLKSNSSTTMGADVGPNCLYVRISRKDRAGRRLGVYIGTPTWDEIPNLIRKFKVGIAVIDAEYDVTKVEEAAKMFRCIKLAYYTSGLREPFVRQGKKVSINRTAAMTGVLESFHNDTNILPIDINSVPGYYDMMRAPTKATKQDSKGNIVTYFPRTNKADHYFHAEVYDLIAGELGTGLVTTLSRGLF